MEPQSYSSGERVFGPPRGTFDADWAATALRSTRPDLDHPTSVRLMERAWGLIREDGIRGDELAAALIERDGVDATTAADVAAVGTEIAQFYLDR
ncbi:MAG: hypothetical protein INR72_12280 [Williamsia herbipolensis]|uniref:Uncharacterized protein n=1 Tax=Williamsia serinedens TaxID=391736 RepID=A0ABT1GZI7_9NOCA|nr:hypothetical protein [Williamsia serinedens]MBE7162015.1 hypothetical protein [Williamsia herbipolensis]MCP2159693.1 hypothetical protein [Williamsia serinedens]